VTPLCSQKAEHTSSPPALPILVSGTGTGILIFNSIAFDTNSHESFYTIDSQEGIWNSGDTSEPNLGYRPRHKEGYFPVPPTDQMHDIRTKMTLKMVEGGIDIEKHHHEVATGGQVEFGMRFNTLLKQADSVMMYKYIAKNVAIQNGYTVTFMPNRSFRIMAPACMSIRASGRVILISF